MEDSAEVRTAEFIDRARQARKDGTRAAALAAFQAAAEISPANDAIKVEVASELRALERLDDARQALEDVLVRAPHFTNALIELGHLCRRQQDRHGALAAFEGAAANHPEHLGLQLEIVRSLRDLDRLDDADARLAQSLVAHPANLAVLIEKAHLARRRGDHATALSAFREAAAVEKDHAGVKLEIVQTLRALGETREAEKLLRRVQRANPGDAAGFVSLVRLLVDDGRPGEALALIRRAPDALATHRSVVRAAIGVARKTGDDAAVLDFLDRAAAIDPHDVQIALDLAAEHRRHGNLDRARQHIERVLALAPTDPRALMEIGYQRRAAHDRAGARAAFAAVVSAERPATQALIELATEEWAAGKPHEARLFLNRALQQDPHHLGARLAHAEDALRGDRPEDALRHAERAVAEHPHALDARLVAARAAAAIPDRQRALGHLDEARSAFGERLEILASRIHILRSLGEQGAAIAAAAAAGDAATHEAAWAEVTAARIVSGDFRAAEAALDALRETHRDTPRVHFFRGQIAEGLRDYSAAATAYETALEADPTNPEGHGEAARASLLDLDLDKARDHLRLSMQHGAASAIVRGQSLNPSQTHVGQLLDDFALDADTVSRLRQIRALPPARRATQLRALVKERPESTAAAIAFVGLIARAIRFRAGRRIEIPQTVVQFWDSTSPPDDVRALMESWQDSDGGWRHLTFDNDAADAFLAEHFDRPVRQAFRRASHPAQRSDIFRLAYMAQAGGIYADADDRRIAPFRTLAPKGATLVAYLENYGTVGNNFFAAVPHHPAVERALSDAVSAINRGDHDVVWLSTGPGLFTRAVAHYLAAAGAREAATVVLRELHEMRLLVDIHCPTRYKATPRHWSRAEFARAPSSEPAANTSAAQDAVA